MRGSTHTPSKTWGISHIMEKVLVTGASGYIGTHVLQALSVYDCEVLVADPRADRTMPGVTVLNQDIFDSDVDHLYERLGSPDRCIHLAWRDGFNHNSNAHIDDLPLHVRFARALFDAGIPSFSAMGSMHEIGYWEGAIDENTPCNPGSYYGIAKNALRQSLQVMGAKGNTSLKWLRGFYITGDDTHSNSVFDKLLAAAQAGNTTFPFTSGKNKFDFLNVDELARQIVAASMQDEIDGIINCCSGVPLSLGARMEQFIEEHDLNITLEYGAFPDRPYDSPGVWGDASKINAILSLR